jgi:hypothetical protein
VINDIKTQRRAKCVKKTDKNVASQRPAAECRQRSTSEEVGLIEAELACGKDDEF